MRKNGLKLEVSQRSPSALLEELAPALRGQGLSLALAERNPEVERSPEERQGEHPLRPLLDALLLPGATVELCALPGAGALSLALRLLRETLRPGFEATLRAGVGARTRRVRPAPWLCALDCARELHAPAVARLGIPLERLLVIAPPLAEVPRLAVRAVRSGVFAGIIVDVTRQRSLATLAVPLRRMTLAAEDCGATVFVLTSPKSTRPVTLPVAARAEVHANASGEGYVEVLRHRDGVPPPLPIPVDDAIGARERAAFHCAPLARPRLPARPATKARGRSD